VGRRSFPILNIFGNRDSEYIKLVALRLIQTPGTVAFLGSRLKGEVVFAQAPGLPTDMSALFRSVVLSAGGRGGGTRELAQGIVNDPKNLEMLLTQACDQLHPFPEPGTSRLRSACESESVRRPRRSAIGG
jgi:alanyl-tRNA synthetase